MAKNSRRFLSMKNEYTIYHVTRNLAKHAFELDDAVYGSPLEKADTDWAINDPILYIQRLKAEKSLLESRKDDLEYLMREKNIRYTPKPAFPTDNAEEVDAHVYSKFHYRSFTYAEKLSYELQSKSPLEIEMNRAKALRQLRVLEAAIEDVSVSLIRFTSYAEQMKK